MKARLLMDFILCFFLFFSPSSQTLAMLPASEVSALQQIGKTLGKDDWDFMVDPCSGQSGWVIQNATKGNECEVTCNCSGTICHVTSIVLKTQGLSGTLPNLSGLPFLVQLDLTRNFLTGTIPADWGTLQLINVSLMSNRLTGTIPEELGNMTTLKNITLENNQFLGVLPPHIGNLTNLGRLILSSNNFTGELPATMGRLRNMADFRISDNSFSGRLPDFIGSWNQLTRLNIQGTDLRGPIPSSYGALTNLEYLIISDIKGMTSSIPQIKAMNRLKTLILRSCNLSGPIRDDFANLTKLLQIDLSFNMLNGTIPESLKGLSSLSYLFLTSNNLSGLIPDWILTANMDIDLSFNNFTGTTSGATPDCQQKNVNFLGSYSTIGNQPNMNACLMKNYPCNGDKRYSSLYIDSGSKASTPTGGRTFEADGEARGAATFYLSPNSNWAMSSTGTYLDNDDKNDDYTKINTSVLSMANPELYMTARISPLSLKYYGLCLFDGPYTVNLHFREIVMSDDKNFSSLGRRIFDVYIQGSLVYKDFNIKDHVDESGKAVIPITANVTSGTLSIHFFWAGKGTTVIPQRGVYGPLVSAIEVTPGTGFKPPGGHKKVILAIVIVIVSAAVLTILVLGFLYIRLKDGKPKWRLWTQIKAANMRSRLLDPTVMSGHKDVHRSVRFTVTQIKAATKNFDPSNKIGEGGFGPVYKGRLPDGTAIAIKKLSSKSQQGAREFVTEIGMISAFQHPNLVNLYGCCIEGDTLSLVYEYMENNSLAHALFAKIPNRIKLDWPTRRKICIGVAKGLAYLHEDSVLKIVHRDIKASNILLDKDLNAKISDFGLAKLDEGVNADTRIVGTHGYMAPEYAMHGQLTCKADVYSFGVVAIEIVTGQSSNSRHSEQHLYLLDWTLQLQESGDALQLVDPDLGSNFSKEEALVILNVALLCTDESPSQRPDMSMVVSMIEGKVPIQSNPEFSSSRAKKSIQGTPSPESWLLDERQEEPWTLSSTSIPNKNDTGGGCHTT